MARYSQKRHNSVGWCSRRAFNRRPNLLTDRLQIADYMPIYLFAIETAGTRHEMAIEMMHKVGRQAYHHYHRRHQRNNVLVVQRLSIALPKHHAQPIKRCCSHTLLSSNIHAYRLCAAGPKWYSHSLFSRRIFRALCLRLWLSIHSFSKTIIQPTA